MAPGNSEWCNMSEIFSEITALVYSSNADSLIITGDFNARTGNLDDFVHSIDKCKTRENLDTTINNHGRDLIDLVRDCFL